MRKKVKRKFNRILSLLLVFVLLCTVPDMTAFAQDDMVETEFEVTYCQTEARSMLFMINEFRAGTGAWEWDSTDTQQIFHTDLEWLVYDYELEKVAMQRAVELVAAYSHTRPNGEKWTSTYPDTFKSVGKAENIAMGPDTYIDSADKAFTLWKEEDKPYSKQGHRRNMLREKSHTVGIAHVVYNNYHYWVQEFGNSIVGETETAANDSRTVAKIEISPNIISSQELKLEEEDVRMGTGMGRELPQAYLSTRTKDYWEYAPSLENPVMAEWSVSSGEDVVSISGGKLQALKEGTAVVAATYSGKGGVLQAELQIKVTSQANFLKKAKTDAKADLKAYAVKLLEQNLYSNTALNEMNMKVADGNSNIDLSINTDDVELTLIWAKGELDTVQPDKTFGQIRQEAKEELAAYKADEKVSSIRKAQWELYISQAGLEIDRAEEQTAVATAVSNGKEKIDFLLSTPVTGAEVLYQKKVEAFDELDAYLATFTLDDYAYDEQAEMRSIVAKAKTAIVKADAQGIDSIVAGAKENLDKMPTKAEKEQGESEQKKEKAVKKAAPAKTSISGKIKAKKRGFIVKWKKQTKNVDGYEVCYSTSKKFPKKGTVTKTISKNTTTKLTVKKLKAKKKYYVRVRTYKKAGGKKYVSLWSSVKKVTTKK